jgi:hypothetical protein
MEELEYKLKTEEYHKNNLRTEIIEWKRGKENYTYRLEEGWEYVNDPSNLPKNNYLLYLLENMPENINKEEKRGWISMENTSLEEEAMAILNIKKLGKGIKENIWIDKRMLGENWSELFNETDTSSEKREMTEPKLKG